MKYSVPVTIIVEATNGLEAENEVKTFLERSAMEWRLQYNVKDFTIDWAEIAPYKEDDIWLEST